MGFYEHDSFNLIFRSSIKFENIEEKIKNSISKQKSYWRELYKLESSYKQNEYHLLFYNIVKHLKIKKCTEIGVLNGYSLFSMGFGLKDNNNDGTIQGFDLFEDYEFKKQKFEIVQSDIDRLGLKNYVEIKKMDAFEVQNVVKNTDLLHVDISNDGDTIEKMLLKWHKKVSKIIIFEGGSIDRDNIGWMKDYGKNKISEKINEIYKIYSEWHFYVLEPFPSMTILLRKSEFPN